MMDYEPPKPKATRGSRACTVCRRLKMKCVGAENGPPCKRCLSGNHECVFEESNRGKRTLTNKKHDVLSKSIKKMEKTLDSVIRSINNPVLAAELMVVADSPSPSPDPPTIHSSPPPSSSSPKLHSLPDNSLNPLGLLAEASLANTNNLRSSFDNNSPPVGVASRNYFKPGPMTILPLRRLYIERQIQPEMLTFVSTDQVVHLFNIFFESLNPLAHLLDPTFHSPSLVCSRSPFLLTTICAIASKFYASHPDLHPRLTDLARSLAFSVPEKGYKSVEIVQAYLLLSLWGCGAAERFERDKTWMLLGMAIRMATDLNLHRKTSIVTADTQNGKTLDMELHNRERTWIMCFVLDRSFSSQMGKPYTIREDYIIRHVKDFYSSPVANELDIAMSAQVQLQQIISHCLDFLYSGTDTPSGLQRKCDYMQVIKSFDAQLRAWWIEWGELRSWQASFIKIAADFFYNYAVLVLNSFGLQNALESISSAVSSTDDSGSRSSSGFSANRINISYFFSKVYNAAHRCAILVRDKLAPEGHLRFLPDNHYVQMSYAVLSLLKLIRPELQPYLSGEKEIINLVKDVAAAMTNAAVNTLHTPALYGNFLKAIIDAKVGGGGGGNGNGPGPGSGGGEGDTTGGEQVDGAEPSSTGGGSGGGGAVVDSEMSPSPSGSGGSGKYHASPASFSSPRSLHSSNRPTRHTPSSSLSHTSTTSQSLPHIDSPSLMNPSILSLGSYPFANSNGEMGPTPIAVDIPGFPGSLPSAAMGPMGSAGLGGSSGLGSTMMAPAGLVSSGLTSASMGGELGEGSTSVMGGGSLTMEDVLSSVFWDSMVVPGFNTLDGFIGGFGFGPGGSGLVTPRQVPGTPL